MTYITNQISHSNLLRGTKLSIRWILISLFSVGRIDVLMGQRGSDAGELS